MIYLVRHGEPAASWGEHPDPGLSEKGHAQAEQTSETLLGLGAKSLISSPLQRCRETAQPFASKLGLSSRIETRVAEVATPPVVDDRVSWLKTMMSGTWTAAGSGMLDWQKSVVEALEELPEDTVVFSHFVAINATVSALTNSDAVMAFRPGHCSITELERKSGALTVKSLGQEANVEVL